MNSGIYIITNQESGKIYIGSTNNFKARWGNHRVALCRGNHNNSHLQRSWDKHGKDAFEFGVLEYLDNIEKLIEVEQFWMNIYREEGKELYNFGLMADNPFGGCRHTKETRCRISETLMSRAGRKRELSPKFSFSGRKHSKESRRRSSEAIRAAWARGVYDSEETRRRMSESHEGLEHSKETRCKMSIGAKRMWARRRAMGVAQSLEKV